MPFHHILACFTVPFLPEDNRQQLGGSAAVAVAAWQQRGCDGSLVTAGSLEAAAGSLAAAAAAWRQRSRGGGSGSTAAAAAAWQRWAAWQWQHQLSGSAAVAAAAWRQHGRGSGSGSAAAAAAALLPPPSRSFDFAKKTLKKWE